MVNKRKTKFLYHIYIVCECYKWIKIWERKQDKIRTRFIAVEATILLFWVNELKLWLDYALICMNSGPRLKI